MRQVLYAQNREMDKRCNFKRLLDDVLMFLGLCSIFIAGAFGLIAWYPWGN